MKLFMDAEQAAAAVGLSVRHFCRIYVDTGKLEPMTIIPSKRGHNGGRRHKRFFKVSDVEKLKRD